MEGREREGRGGDGRRGEKRKEREGKGKGSGMWAHRPRQMSGAPQGPHWQKTSLTRQSACV